MGYLDTTLGIKSVNGIKKYLTKHFKDKGVDVSLDCVKVANSVRIFWAINNYLHHYDMKNSFVLYVIKEDELNATINAIEESLKQR